METTETPQIEQVLGKIQGLEKRDLRVWLMNLAIILALTAGLHAFVLPKLLWNLKTLELSGRYFHQFSFGLSLLIVLYNIYTFDLRRRLNITREELVRQLLRVESAQALSFLDPLTGVFNRRHLDRIIPKETRRADRLGGNLTFLLIDLDEFKSVNTRFGHIVGDQVLKELARLLTKTLRTSDEIVRYGGDEFVVVMPDCSEDQGEHALNRLRRSVDQWNQVKLIPEYQMSLSCGLAAYQKGLNVEALLGDADRRMYQDKARRRRVN